jgi:dTDP-4-amino-4,6-dideoxygalactose transaminase
MEVKYYDFNYMHQPVKMQMVKKFEEIYDAGWFILGKNVEEFESQFAGFCGVNHCIGVANGLDALIIALKTLNIGPGDEVIVPSNTYIASWLAVSAVGAIPVPVEPNPKTYNIDPDKIEKAITSRTKVIMPVHLYGQPCEMDSVMITAATHNLFVVEDNAQSQGAVYNERITGSFGNINATSFYPGKNLGALGDAGAITTNDQDLAKRAMTIRNYGSTKKYYNDELGLNSRLDELQAGFLSVKLPYLEQWNSERRNIASTYNQLLQGINGITLPETAKGANPVYHLYVIMADRRDNLQTFLTLNGIGTLIHYPVPPHLQVAYKHLGYKIGDFPIAEGIANNCLSLPIYPGLGHKELEYITEKIRLFYSKT